MSTKNRMTGIKLAAAAVGIAGLMVAAPVPASDSINVQVNASVLGVCKFNSGQTPAMTIANSGVVIDPSLAVPATGSTTILYRCTKGSVPSFALTGGATATLACTTPATCAGETMAATITLTPPGSPNGQGFSTDLTLTVDGSITTAAFGAVSVGDYSVAKQVTINP